MNRALHSCLSALVLCTALAAQGILGEEPPGTDAGRPPVVQEPAARQPVLGESQPGEQSPPPPRTLLPGEQAPGTGNPPAPRQPVEGEVVIGGGGASPLGGANAVPAAQRTAFGNSNNNIPFSWTPTRYQQVFVGSELPNALAIQGLALRQDQAFSNRVGHAIDLEIYMGYTTLTPATLTNDFVGNYTGTRTRVFARKWHKLADMGAAPTDPYVFFEKIPYDGAFNYVPAAGRNLLVEVIVHGNTNGNATFTYPLDAQTGAGTTTTRLYNTSSVTAATGTLGVSYGLVMCFLAEPVTKNVVPAALAHDFGNSNNNIPFSWTPTRYQQLFLGSELPNPLTIERIALRQDQSFGNNMGRTVELEMWLGYSSHTPATLTTTFDSNFSAGKTLVFTRKNVSYPNQPPPNTDPSDFLLRFACDNPFPWNPAGGNLLWEVKQYSNSNGNMSFTYPLDADSSTTSTRLYNTSSPNAATGTLGVNFGLAVCFVDQGDRNCITLPEPYTSRFGPSNNNIPFSWSPTRYQQVFPNSDVPRAMTMVCMGLRQDDQFNSHVGRNVELEIKLARTTKTPATLTNTFASNLDSGGPTTVFNRKTFRLPNMPPSDPVDPDRFFCTFPFDNPYAYSKASSDNFLVEVYNYGNDNGNMNFTYPLDAVSSGTSRLFSSSPTATTGTLGLNSGLVMCFFEGNQQAGYTLFGNACSGSGPHCETVPASLAAAFGNSNNNIPFSWTPITYQQVFAGTELPASATLCGVGLRQDQSFRGNYGYRVSLSIDLGHTSFTPATLTTSFAANFDRPGRMNVFNATLDLPEIPNVLPTDPTKFFLQIPTNNWPYSRATGNLLIQIDQTGNSNGNSSFTYPLDAGSSVNTTRLYGTGATGTLGLNFGLAMCFLTGTGGVPYLVNDGEPVIGNSHRLNLFHARRNAPSVLFVGVSNSTWMSLPLPFHLGPFGAPGCYFNSSGEIQLTGSTNACGMRSTELRVPKNFSWEGVVLYNQYVVLDGAANPLGLATSNGGRMLLGTY